MGERGGSSTGSYLVAGSRPWNRVTFDEHLAALPGRWRFVSSPDELAAAVDAEPPRYAFFLHWSSIVPARIFETCECVVFHAADVPYGRGGSPIQNLIARGHDDTMLTALRMTAEVDGGPVYAKVPLSLAGTAQEIYERADRAAVDMIAVIAADEPSPTPQEGTPVVFARRTPDQSEVGVELTDLDALERHIRMLDADGYPHAYVDHGSYRISFRRATRTEGALVAEATIVRREEDA